jgi:hypothetical protein
MSSEYEAKARDWLGKADRKLRSFAFFGNKYEDAAEAYERAANQFKLAKLCEFFTRGLMGALARSPLRLPEGWLLVC